MTVAATKMLDCQYRLQTEADVTIQAQWPVMDQCSLECDMLDGRQRPSPCDVTASA